MPRITQLVNPAVLTTFALLGVASAIASSDLDQATARDSRSTVREHLGLRVDLKVREAGRVDGPLAIPAIVREDLPEAIPGVREFTGDVVARPRQDLAPRDRAAALDLLGDRVRRHVVETDEFIVEAARGPEVVGEAERDMIATLLLSGLFQYAEPDWMLFPVGEPDDPRFAEQWHHVMVESPAAWDVLVGCDEVIVAVTDTGIVDHEDLGNRVPGYNAVSDLAEADGGDLSDIHGHGTHVAGCAAATGNNGVGVAGMGWTLKVMPIRVSEAGNGGASMSNLLEGSRWAIENGAKITSASYSGIGAESIETTGEYIRGLDGSLMWAAGNSGTNHAAWDFEHVIVVGASNANDDPAGFSGRGRGVDLFAPGVGILSSTSNGGYAAYSGTSMATPVANGALAMIRCANPDLDAAHAEAILLHSCDWWDGYAETEMWGHGRLNLRRAVEFALAAASPQAPVANDDFFPGLTVAPVVADVLSNDYDLNMDPLEIESWDATTSLGDAVLWNDELGMLEVVPAAGAAEGPRTFFYTIVEPNSGETASAVATVDLALPRAAVVVEGSSPGLFCEYYELSAPEVLPDFDALVAYASEVVPQVDFESTGEEFAGSGRADEVGAVYTGWVDVPEAGLWTLITVSDDGSKLWIGDELVVDNDGLHGMRTRSGAIALAAGLHPMRLEFFENGGGAGLRLRWSGPNVGTQAIPAERLAHGGEVVVSPDLDGNGMVNGADLAILLGAWGDCGDCGSCPADFDGDCVVGGADLAVLLGAWGG
jgi:hypothetical protein